MAVKRGTAKALGIAKGETFIWYGCDRKPIPAADAGSAHIESYARGFFTIAYTERTAASPGGEARRIQISNARKFWAERIAEASS